MTVQCTGTTKAGNQCKNRTTEGDKCRQHLLTKTPDEIVTQCTGTTKRGTRCKHKVKIGDLCPTHKNDIKPAANFYPDKDPSIEHKEKYCPLIDKEGNKCGALEVWHWMGTIGLSRYQISSHGRVYNVITKKYLIGSPSVIGYRSVNLTKDDGKLKTKGIHTYLGIQCCGLKWLDNDSEVTVTMDHINGIKTDNYLCCNLRTATKSQQSTNQSHPSGTQGRIVLKLSDIGEILSEFVSITMAAKDANVIPDTMSEHCISGVKLGEYQYRFFDKRDLPDHKWISTFNLYPNIQPPMEVSDGGWIRKDSGRITKGTKSGRYYIMRAKDVEKNGQISFYVHILVWTIFNNRLVSKDLEISHINWDGTDNRLINLEECTHSKNVRTNIENGPNKQCIKVRKHLHDGRYVDYDSIREANRLANKASRNGIKASLKDNQRTAGMCECGKGYTWTRI